MCTPCALARCMLVFTRSTISDPPAAALLVRVSRRKLLRVRPGHRGPELVAPPGVPLEHLGRVLVERLEVGPAVLGVAGEAHVLPGSARVLLGPTQGLAFAVVPHVERAEDLVAVRVDVDAVAAVAGAGPVAAAHADAAPGRLVEETVPGIVGVGGGLGERPRALVPG